MSTHMDERPSELTQPARREWGLSTLKRAARPRIVSEYAEVISHHPLAERYMALTLRTSRMAETALPGQFVMLTAARAGEKAPALPRPMAIYSVDKSQGIIEVLYGMPGRGTQRLSGFLPGEAMQVVGPLGQPFVIPEGTASVLLIGRGIGTCSLTTVAQQNATRGVATIAVTSARTRSTLIGGDLYRQSDAHAVFEVTDAEGTSTPEALFATLTSALDASPPELILTCGSTRLTALSQKLGERWGTAVQVSVEAHMACGIGYCHGCASGARSVGEESPLICNDGPVFDWRELDAEES